MNDEEVSVVLRAGRAGLHRTTAALLAALMLLAAPLARAGLSQLLGLQESSKLAKAYAVLPESFYPGSVAWSPDGKYIADTGTQTLTIHVWDVNAKQVVQTLQQSGPVDTSQALAWSSDGRYLASCGKSLRIWDAQSWDLVKDTATGSTRSDPCLPVAFSSDGRWLALGYSGISHFGEICVYSTQDWALKQCTNYHLLPRTKESYAIFTVLKIAFQPGTDVLAIAANGYFKTPNQPLVFNSPSEGRVFFWDVSGPPPNLLGAGLADSILAYSKWAGVIGIAYSPDGKQLATGSDRSSRSSLTDTVEVWDAQSHQRLAMPLVSDIDSDGQNQALSYTADGRYLLAAFEEKSGPVVLIDTRTLQHVDTVHTFALGAEAMAVEPHGSRFVVTAPNKLMVWSIQDKP